MSKGTDCPRAWVSRKRMEITILDLKNVNND